MQKKLQEDKRSSEYISDFLTFIRLIEDQYNLSSNAVHETDKASQDILHQIEFGSYRDRGKFATQLSKIRKERRFYKDFVEIHTPLCDYIKSKEFIKVKRDLEEILGKLRKEETKTETQRFYRPRILTNLTIRTSEKRD